VSHRQAARPAHHPHEPSRPGKAAIFRAVRAGSRRCRNQREWQQAGLAAIESEPWYANRKRHYAAIVRQFTLHMDWREKTSRPGHDQVAAAVGVSADTVARCVRWLEGRGLIGVVSPGCTPLIRAHVLHGDEGNLAVVYVLTVPRKRKHQLPSPCVSKSEFADLSRSRSELDKAPRAREAETPVKPEMARAPRGLPVLPRAGTASLHSCPQTRSEGLQVARAVRERSADLRLLSDRRVRHLMRPYVLAGWTGADVLWAVDHEPGGRQHGYTVAPRFPAAWAAARLGAWLDPRTGAPLPSRSQLADTLRRQAAAEQAERRAQHAAGQAQAADYAAQASRARELLAAASAAAARVIAATSARTLTR
jgi:hypothetical protein